MVTLRHISIKTDLDQNHKVEPKRAQVNINNRKKELKASTVKVKSWLLCKLIKPKYSVTSL